MFLYYPKMNLPKLHTRFVKVHFFWEQFGCIYQLNGVSQFLQYHTNTRAAMGSFRWMITWMLFFTCTLFKNLHLIQLKQNHKKRTSKRSKVEQKRGICTATLQISPWQDINWQLSRPGPDHCIGSTAFFWPHLCKSHWVPMKVVKFLKLIISLNLLYNGR